MAIGGDKIVIRDKGLVSISSNDGDKGHLGDKLVAGDNITLTENNDGGAETLTIASTASGGGGSEEYIRLLDTDVNAASVSTDQNWFLATAPTFTFPSRGTWFFEGSLRLETGSDLSHNIRIGFASTNLISLLWSATGAKATLDYSSLAYQAAISHRSGTATATATMTNTGRHALVLVRGWVRTTAAGATLTPEFSFSNGSVASPLVGRGTYFRVWKVDDSESFTTDTGWA